MPAIITANRKHANCSFEISTATGQIELLKGAVIIGMSLESTSAKTPCGFRASQAKTLLKHAAPAR
eukprot:2755228-Pleurochrysis_carterae.AAC.1